MQKLSNKLEIEYGGHLRNILSTVTAMSTKMDIKEDSLEFEATLAKNRLKKLFPFTGYSEELNYMFSFVEIKRALVASIREEYRSRSINKITIHQLGGDFVQSFLSADFAAHLFWHNSLAKG